MSADDEHRRGELHLALSTLVEKHGLEDVDFILRVIREDLADAGIASKPGTLAGRPARPGRSVRTAVSYEGRLITDGARAILWWIPSATSPIGQAAWVPHALVIEAIDPPRRTLEPAPPLGVLKLTRPIAWRRATLTGNSIRFLDGDQARRAS